MPLNNPPLTPSLKHRSLVEFKVQKLSTSLTESTDNI